MGCCHPCPAAPREGRRWPVPPGPWEGGPCENPGPDDPGPGRCSGGRCAFGWEGVLFCFYLPGDVVLSVAKTGDKTRPVSILLLRLCPSSQVREGGGRSLRPHPGTGRPCWSEGGGLPLEEPQAWGAHSKPRPRAPGGRGTERGLSAAVHRPRDLPTQMRSGRGWAPRLPPGVRASAHPGAGSVRARPVGEARVPVCPPRASAAAPPGVGGRRGH